MEKYTPLLTLFYSDKELYQTEIEARKSNRNAVTLDFEISGHRAFFLPEADLYERILSVSRLLNAVRSIALPPIAVKHFKNKCLIDELVVTHAIEGVHSSRRDIGDVLERDNIDGRKIRFVGIVNKYNRLDTDRLITSVEDIRAVYDEMLAPEIEDLPDGVLFRDSGVDVLSPAQKVIHRGVTPETRVIELLRKGLKFLSDKKVEPIFRTGVFHYLFGYVHPFYDGNGRMNRYISSLFIARELHPLMGYRLSFTIDRKKSAYYKAFDICNNPYNCGDITPFLHMFASIIEEAATELYLALNERVNILGRCYAAAERLPGGNASDNSLFYMTLLIAALFAENGITSEELSCELRISKPTVYKRLKVVRSLGLLNEKQVGNKKYYCIDPAEIL